MFEVSPDNSGFLMRLSGAAVPAPVSCLPCQPGSDSYCESMLGDPVAFTLSGPIPGSDSPPMTFPVYPLPSGLELLPGQSSVQTILASAVSLRPDGWSTGVPRTYDVSREGPFDTYGSPMDTGDSPLVAIGLSGCLYRITSYTGPEVADTNPEYGIQLHHPRFLEFIRAPESARLLYRSPTFWVQRMGEEDAMAAAINLQRDAGVMTNLQILSQFVTSLHWMSTEMLNLGMGHVVFPSQEVTSLPPAPRAPRAAQYVAAIGLWHPQMGPGDPEPVPTSSCNVCMNWRYCFTEGCDFFREVTLCLLVLLGRYGLVISNRSPDYINVCSVLLWTNINIWTGRMPASVMTCNSVLA